jgi:hypothetical protein
METCTLEVNKLIASAASTLQKLTFVRGVSHEPLPQHCEMVKLHYLRVDQRILITTPHLPIFVRNCRNLLYFKCSDMGGSDDCLHALGQSCPSLVSLHYGNAAPDSRAGLEAVLLACRELHTVDLMEDYVFTLTHCATVIQHCRKLKALKLKLNIPDDGTAAAYIAVLQPRLCELRHLSLERWSCPVNDTLLQLALHCGQLRSLGLRSFSGDRKEAVVLGQLLSAFPTLESVDLSRVRCLTDAVLAAIGSSCSRLRCLNLSGAEGFTHQGVMSLVTGCPALTCLYVAKENALFNELARSLWQRIRPALTFNTDPLALTRWDGIELDM